VRRAPNRQLDLGELVGLDLGERLAPVSDEIGTRPSFAPAARRR
jgi:hypothetical protein